MAKNEWDEIVIKESKDIDEHHEANLLMLDCSKSNKLLKWAPVWEIETTIRKTINWYKDFYQHNKVNTINDINNYVNDAEKKKIVWVK